jgi:hypothetical protein
MLKIKALRESRLRAEHVDFSFMKRRVQSLMVRDTLGYQYTGDEDTSRIRRGCPATKSKMKTLLRSWAGYSKICHRPHPAQSPSTPRLVRRTRLVANNLCF